MLSRIRWFLIITAILLLVVFSLSNTESVSVRMPLVFTREIPLAMLLVIAAMLGFMVGALWTAWMLRRNRQPKTPAASPPTTNPPASAPNRPPASRPEEPTASEQEPTASEQETTP